MKGLSEMMYAGVEIEPLPPLETEPDFVAMQQIGFAIRRFERECEAKPKATEK